MIPQVPIPVPGTGTGTGTWLLSISVSCWCGMPVWHVFLHLTPPLTSYSTNGSFTTTGLSINDHYLMTMCNLWLSAYKDTRRLIFCQSLSSALSWSLTRSIYFTGPVPTNSFVPLHDLFSPTKPRSFLHAKIHRFSRHKCTDFTMWKTVCFLLGFSDHHLT